MNRVNPQQELALLVNLLLDGVASEAEELQLSELLRHDEAARAEYIRLVELHALLQADYVSVALQESAAEFKGNRSPFSVPLWTAPSGVAIALTALMAFVLWRPASPADRPVLWLESIAGSVTWTDARLVSHSGMAPGSGLSQGSLVIEGDQAAAQARFADGTQFTLSGGTELAFSEDRQKRLVLRQGSLTAKVHPQPLGQPLVVQTNSAEIEVLGTVFALAAERERTTLNVESGEVLFKRLADGEQINVPERHSAGASFDTSEELLAGQPRPPATHWRRDFQMPPLSNWRGKWVSAQAGEVPFVQGVPCASGKRSDGTAILHYAVTARGNDPRLVTLTPQSFVRIRYRTAMAAPLRVFLGVQMPSGAFGGNFEVKLTAEEGQDAVGQWRWLSLPVADFPPVAGLAERHPAIPSGGELSLLMVTTFEHDTGLEVAEIVVDEGP